LNFTFLIAHPLAFDGFFNKSVVLITSHTKQESFGFVINFKTLFKLRDLRPQIKNGNIPVFDGGPVGRNQLFYIHTLGEIIPNTQLISKNIYIGGDFDEILNAVETGVAHENNLKLFMGYSGWGPSQLQNEIDKNHWFKSKANTKQIFEKNSDSIWKTQLELIKPSYAIFGDILNQPSIN